ncbi:TetR/AcrR family transcriptional regulator [Oscillatoria sp. CS-180]|uniref:TetR/AcrR family transcriptional regulator n=1 Tax=Oscillatoria sp. CS-180 TaxID=3021720 RepID=UPI00232D4710|nr:TetR/AcrR family transcriptional regulator [Oscillatoria sp. CS-180]MDB9529831.1 TetR/AcrR family transcriptional regulator [Oscillatoria sp. CS-180]
MTAALNKNDKATQILDGALQEFLARGYAGTSMDRVAATAGVSKPTVYNHFQDKEGLFRALVQKIARERFQLKFTPESFGTSAEESLPRLLALMVDTIADDDDYQDFVRLVIGESGRFPELARTFITYLSKPGLELMQCYLKEHPEFGFADSQAIAQIILGSAVYMCLTQHILHGRDIMPLSKERYIETIVTLMLKSIHPPRDQKDECR